ncbi:acyl-CoA thioesterase [Luteimonas panaciterrae]|uniref:acyl-CoA thioesterase n=1 Tax=Luteimonas panaciterrae TaxID=363885 RepID=UPI001CFA3A85|nr:acyl-CoA thioesterase [Luteimonas panaciterrae]
MTPLPDTQPREARLLEMVFPDHTNHLGTLFGGQALAWMDKAAFIAASRYARRTVVTARSEQVDFELPIRQGQLVETVARVISTGNSSMQVEVELIAEDLLSGERELCTRGRFVMIALDVRGRPAPVPRLVESDTD